MNDFWVQFIQLILFTLAIMGTPGPANITITAYGISHGFRKGMPFVLGIISGFSFVIVVSGAPMTYLTTVFPQTSVILAVAGTLYALYLAWGIAMSTPSLPTEAPDEAGGKRRGPSFWYGVLFTPLNPKAYLIAILVLSNFPDVFEGRPLIQFLKLFFFLEIMALLIHTTWLMAASTARRWITSITFMRRLNIVLAILLVGSVVWAFSVSILERV